MPRATAFIADANALARLGLRTILEAIRALEIVGEAVNDVEAVARIHSQQPDLALLSLYLPEQGGLDVVARVARLAPATRSILIADQAAADPNAVLSMGAAGFVVAAGDASEVPAAIRAVLAGRAYVSAAATQATGRMALPAVGGSAVRRLSPRQREVLRMIAEGASAREIAGRLERSVKTIETHRAQLMRRLDVDSVAELVKVAIRAGLVPLHG